MPVWHSQAEPAAQQALSTSDNVPQGHATRGHATSGATSGAMVVAAHPLAAQAGRDILAQGGSAMDAAIAIQSVLGLVEPQSSGLAGGGFMLHYEAAKDELTSWDGREIAPAAIKPDIFITQTGKPQAFTQAMTDARAIGVPGVPALLAAGHKRFGRLNWEVLFEPAIELAETGFKISPRLYYLLHRDKFLRKNPTPRALYYHIQANGTAKAKPVGTVLQNPAYAETLKQFAKQGAPAFYTGKIGAQIVAETSRQGGLLTAQDMRHYQAKQRPPLCLPYRAYKICSIGPPSSGGIALLQILGHLSVFDMASFAPNSLPAVHLISEASHLAFADRNLYVGDSDFVSVPIADLLNMAYLRRRGQRINPNRALSHIAPGQFTNKPTTQRAPNHSIAQPSTTHFVVRDKQGNAVSMTSSIEAAFGSRFMAGGMMLNNQLTDFSFLPEKNGKKIANAVAPHKRPRSSITPEMIFDKQGRLFALLGSPGGPRIIGYVAQTVIGLIDWQLSMQEAIDLPRHVAFRGVIELEADTQLGDHMQALQSMGHKVTLRAHHSGLHGIKIIDQMLTGGADPRREGIVLHMPE
ncbi:MAG: gamma-glutamyltransferase [Alphaproteobacteria bacterium]|nr:gamma-glutamyltransferase [Alphaproteobacteria bacterium]